MFEYDLFGNEKHRSRDFLLRIILSHVSGQTAEEFAEEELERMNACPICGGTGNIGAVLPCPECGMNNIDAFNEHLDECDQCRENPFGLCDIGRQLLAGTVEDD